MPRSKDAWSPDKEALASPVQQLAEPRCLQQGNDCWAQRARTIGRCSSPSSPSRVRTANAYLPDHMVAPMHSVQAERCSWESLRAAGEALPVEGREDAIGPEQADVLGMPAVWSSQTLPLCF